MIKIKSNFKQFYFPAGEKHYIVEKNEVLKNVDVIFHFENNGEIFELILLVDAIKRSGMNIGDLYMPYVPYARQDRVNIKGEPLSIKVFCDLINSLGFKKVSIVDPHSDVTTALLNNCEVIHQSEYYFATPLGDTEHFLVSPDAGSLKKIRKCVNANTLEVIECSKNRDVKTGGITNTKVDCYDFDGIDCIIVDDICDGGRTFIEIAKVLKEKNAGKISLYITHGIFSKGLGVFDGLIDEIYTMKGRHK